MRVTRLMPGETEIERGNLNWRPNRVDADGL
jgi:hypothetical protein